MTPPRTILATLTQAHRTGAWGARSAQGQGFVVPEQLLNGEGNVAPRSGVRVALTVIDGPDGPQVTAVSRQRRQFTTPRPSKELSRELKRSAPHQTRILVVGRTGVGKSSTINSIIGTHVASIGHFEPTTSTLHFYNGRIEQFPILIADTPGFADTRSDRSRDSEYVDLILRLTGHIDLLLFVTGLDDSRVEKGELDTIDVLTRRLSADIWDRSIVLLTRSDRVGRRDFRRVLEGRTGVLRKAFSETLGDRAASMPFVPISNERMRTPDKKQWMGELWTQMLRRMSDNAFESFALSTLARLEVASPPRIPPLATSSPAGSIHRVDARSPESNGRIRDWRTETESPNLPSPVAPQAAVTDGYDAVDLAPVSLLPLAPIGSETSFMDQYSPTILSPTPQEVEYAPGPQVVSTSFTDAGFRVTRTEFDVAGNGPIIVNGDQARVIQHVVNQRAPGLLDRLASIGSWIWKRISGLFGGAG